MTETRLPGRGARIAWVILGVVIAGILAWFGLLAWSSYRVAGLEADGYTSFQAVPTNTAEIAALEGNAGMKFPPSAHDIYGHVTGFREVDTLVRFSMKPGELEPFLRTTLCNTALEDFVPSAEQKAAEMRDPLPWDRPFQAKVLKHCSGEMQYLQSTYWEEQAVFVDESDPAVYVVYVSSGTVSKNLKSAAATRQP